MNSAQTHSFMFCSEIQDGRETGRGVIHLSGDGPKMAAYKRNGIQPSACRGGPVCLSLSSLRTLYAYYYYCCCCYYLLQLSFRLVAVALTLVTNKNKYT